MPMRQYWSALQSSLVSLPLTSDPALAPLAPEFTKIVARLEQLNQALQRTEQGRQTPCEVDPDAKNLLNAHREVRDCFKAINLLCAAARRQLPAGEWSVQSEADNTEPRRVAGRLLDDLELLSNELKRHHYTRAVHADVQAYTEDTVRLLGQAQPGQAFKRPGSEIRRSSEVRFGARASKFALVGAVGPAVSVHLQKEKVVSVDDDLDVVEARSKGFKAKAGVQAKFGKLFTPAGKGGHVASLFFNLTGYRSWASYVQYDNVSDQTKAAVVRNGDRTRKWLHRSGDTDSAGAKYRQAKNKTVRVLRMLTGRTRVEPGYAMPLVFQQKSEKGAYNAGAINELSSRVANSLAMLTGHPPDHGAVDLGALAAQAYPSVPALFNQARQATVPTISRTGRSTMGRMEAAADLPTFFNPVTDIHPLGTLSGAAGALSQRKSGLGVEGGAVFTSTDFADQGHNKGRFHAQAHGSVEYLTNAIDFQRLRPAHTLLDPGYNRSLARSRVVLDSLEAVYRERPKLHLHRHTEAVIAQDVKKFHAAELQCAQGIDNQLEALTAMRTRYLKLTELAGFYNTVARDKRYRKTVPADVMKKFDDDLEQFIEETFGLTKATVGAHAAFRDKLFADPAFFMIEAYDAISIAFGSIGMQAYQTKAALQQDIRTSPASREILFNGVAAVDDSFSELCNILDQVHLPINPERLMRSGGIEMVSLAASKSWKCDLNAAVGFAESPLQNLSGNAGDPTANVEGVTRTRPRGNVAAATMGAGVTGTLLWKDVRVHGNTVRTGTFRQIKLNIQGVGLCAPAIEAAVIDGINRKKGSKKGNRSDAPPDAAHPALDKSTADFIASTWTLLARSEMSAYDVEGECVWNHRRPPKTNGDTYERALQNVRFIRRRTVRNDIDLGVPLALSGVPLAITVHAGYTCSASTANVELELMGPCPSYNILMFPAMRQALSMSLRDGINTLHSSKPLAPQYDFAKLRAVFRPEPGQALAETAGDGDFDAEYMLHKYFGSPETIVGTMEKFLTYSKNSRKFQGEPRRASGPLNEFHRFDNDTGLWDTVCRMGSAERLAPGSAPDRYGNTREPFGSTAADPAPVLDPRPRMTLQEQRAIQASRRYFRMNPDMSSAERMAYFVGSDSPHGQVAFNAYCRVIAAFERINSAAKSNVGYKYEVRNRDLKHRAQ